MYQTGYVVEKCLFNQIPNNIIHIIKSFVLPEVSFVEVADHVEKIDFYSVIKHERKKYETIPYENFLNVVLSELEENSCITVKVSSWAMFTGLMSPMYGLENFSIQGEIMQARNYVVVCQRVLRASGSFIFSKENLSPLAATIPVKQWSPENGICFTRNSSNEFEFFCINLKKEAQLVASASLIGFGEEAVYPFVVFDKWIGREERAEIIPDLTGPLDHIFRRLKVIRSYDLD